MTSANKAPTPGQTAFSKYPDEEVRRPRETFTAVLAKVCAKLDAAGPTTVRGDDILGKRMPDCEVQPLKLWVVGSYARGALTCGDLDLVLEYKQTGESVPCPKAIKKAFVGGYPAVRLYLGSPDENSSGANFAEAVELWAPGKDWRANLDAIAVDPRVGRFERPADALVLRPEQLLTTFEQLRFMLERQQEGLLQWRFIPLSHVLPVFEPPSLGEERIFELFADKSKARGELLPLVRGLVHKLCAEESAQGPYAIDYFDDTLSFGGTRFFFARVPRDLEQLNQLNCSRLVYMPKLNTRGPNGFLVLERGPQHELVAAASSLKAWVLVDKKGQQAHMSTDYGRFGTAVGAEFAGSFEQALEMAEFYNGDLDREDPAERALLVEPRLCEGRELLERLAALDCVLFGDGVEVAVTRTGSACLSEEAKEPIPAAAPLQVLELLRKHMA